MKEKNEGQRFDVFASVYVGLPEYPQNKNFEYMKFLKENNIETIFISGHMPEVLPGFLEDLKETIDYANEIGLKVILDVSKKTLDEMGIPKGIYSLRLDYGFNRYDILELLKEDFYVEINASITQTDEVEFLISKGADFSKLRISHNFYPKLYTGLSQEDVKKKNELYKSLGLKIMAYVPSVSGKRPPMFEGLPTIEEHRHLDLYGALADLAILGVDEVCFGDAYCSEEELFIALNYRRDLITIPIVVYEGISEEELMILNRTHANRRDANPYFVRSSFRTKNTINSFNTIERLPKMITVDNEGFLRYQGEVGIMRQNLKKDERVNIVGKALISDFLLENIKPGQRFKFVVRGTIK